MREAIRVLVVCGHPRGNSFCHALADAYAEGAGKAGADVRRLDLQALDFDIHVRNHSPNQQPCEPDIARARELITWAQHIVFAYPTWWGTMPALLKGFLDRVLTPGYAFDETEDPSVWVRLLEGRTAQLLVTMDTPPWVYRFIYGQPGHNAMRKATLGFCGIEPVFINAFGPVKPASEPQRLSWLEKAREEGAGLARRLALQRFRDKCLNWVRILRLQFYPMTWVAYTLGALAASQGGAAFSSVRYWLGYAIIFLVEVITVLCNEYIDYDSDRRNGNAGPFNGGSRVLVEGGLSNKEVRLGILAAGIILAVVVTILFSLPGPLGALDLFLMGAFGVLAVGYTFPPLKLSYRGLGELDVGLTHSIIVILCGYVIQTGQWGDPYPWLLGIPLFFATLPSIILSGIPDHDADRAVGKRTAAVILGPARAARAAMAATVLALLSAWVLMAMDVFSGAIWNVNILIAIHALALVHALWAYVREGAPVKRINGLMVLSLTYVLWFGLTPLIELW